MSNETGEYDRIVNEEKYTVGKVEVEFENTSLSQEAVKIDNKIYINTEKLVEKIDILIKTINIKKIDIYVKIFVGIAASGILLKAIEIGILGWIGKFLYWLCRWIGKVLYCLCEIVGTWI